ncbi:MAG: hypothetical protein KatS3mg057_0459 [Herpetosiphonaceae bacterium]|nr:MAG: hypothetical protein KatS3mg057_0459 [Herpetosiphonaceae bacterium]
MRRGRVHRIEGPNAAPTCRHLSVSELAGYICIPLIAQGEALGILHLERQKLESASSGGDEFLAGSKQRLAVAVAEHVALSLANLKLRETLRSQAIRDPLTGLFNRRYMEESLEREIRRAARSQRPLGVIMIDLDLFKRFNDSFGHAAGDALLRELGSFLYSQVRGEDIACRYGGEEFAIILPEAHLLDTRHRAEQLREGIKRLSIRINLGATHGVTASLGVAAFPEHGPTGEMLLRAADSALYRAKSSGGDCVMVAPVGDDNGHGFCER